jgi:predicted RNase H-like HicB family nuclease
MTRATARGTETGKGHQAQGACPSVHGCQPACAGIKLSPASRMSPRLVRLNPDVDSAVVRGHGDSQERAKADLVEAIEYLRNYLEEESRPVPELSSAELNFEIIQV